MTADKPTVESSHNGNNFRRKAYAACMYCPCVEKWEIKEIFLCQKDAAAMCENKIRVAVREGRPLEHWHVEAFLLCDGIVTWGCRCIEQPDLEGAPDCV